MSGDADVIGWNDYRPCTDKELDSLFWESIENSASDMRCWKEQLRGTALTVWQEYVDRTYPDLNAADRTRLAEKIWHNCES